MMIGIMSLLIQSDFFSALIYLDLIYILCFFHKCV